MSLEYDKTYKNDYEIYTVYVRNKSRYKFRTIKIHNYSSISQL